MWPMKTEMEVHFMVPERGSVLEADLHSNISQIFIFFSDFFQNNLYFLCRSTLQKYLPKHFGNYDFFPHSIKVI